MNEEIKQISNFLQKNKDHYFSIKYGNSNSIEDILFEPISENNKGAKIFESSIRELNSLSPEYIVVEVYKKAAKTFKKNPEFVRKIIVRKSAFEGFSGLDLFGGLNGAIETKTNLSILKSEKERLAYEVQSLRTSIENLRTENNHFEKENKNLQEQIRDLKYDNKDLKRKAEDEIENINKRSQQLDRFITLGGTIIANVAGLDENSIKGLLGLDDKNEQTKEIAGKEKSEVSFSAESHEKQKSREIAKQIFNAFNVLIDENEGKDAYTLLSKFGEIYNFIIEDIDNLNNIYDLIHDNSKTI